MKHYETVFILTPVLSEQQMKETVDGFKAVITSNGGEIVNEELWGMRKLAYPIDHKSTGFYSLIEFDAEPDFVERLDTAFRRDEKVLRSLIFHLDKDAHEYAIKRRSLKSAAKAEPETVNEEAKED